MAQTSAGAGRKSGIAPVARGVDETGKLPTSIFAALERKCAGFDFGKNRLCLTATDSTMREQARRKMARRITVGLHFMRTAAAPVSVQCGGCGKKA